MAEPPPSAFSTATKQQQQYKTHFKNQQDQELIRLALHQSPFFSCLDKEQLDRLVNAAELKHYHRDEIVILEGCVDDDEEDESVEDSTVASSSSSSSPPLETTTVGSIVLDDVSDLDTVVDGPAEADDYTEEEEEEVDYNTSSQRTASTTGQSDDRSLKFLETTPVVAESSQTSGIDDCMVQPVPKIDDLPGNTNDGDGKDEKSSPPSLEVSSDGDPSEISSFSSNLSLPSFLRTRTNLESQSAQIELANSGGGGGGGGGGVTCGKDVDETSSSSHPPPPRSGIVRSLYIVRQGSAGVWYQQPRFNPAQLRPGTLFGEGGFLFGRQHSASIVATTEPLECWAVDSFTFRNYVLPSENMRMIFQKHANKKDEKGNLYMSMDDFVEVVSAEQSERNSLPTMPDPLTSLRIAKSYSILRQNRTHHLTPSTDEPKIYLNDFCFFHFLMARPDPEVDIAFLLMDEKQTGQIFLNDLAKFLRPVFPDLDFQSQFFQRYFGKNGSQSIRQTHFSQFLVDLQREMGKQAFLRTVERYGTAEGYLAPNDFVRVLKTACGWRLPHGVANRLDDIYCHDNASGSQQPKKVLSAEESSKETSVHRPYDEQRENCLGDQYFAYGDFLAFQEVLGNLPFICNLIDRTQELKKGPVSRDDFKVANRVLGLGGRLSRRQVEIVFSLFDLDRDGYVSLEDTVNVCGVDFARRLVPVKGRGDRLTFAPPPQYRPEEQEVDDEQALVEKMVYKGLHFGIAAFVGGLSVGILYPIDLVKTRLMNQRIGPDGSRMYRGALDCVQQAFRGEGLAGLYRGLTPQLLGVAPERAIKLQVHGLLLHAFHVMEDEENFSEKRPSLWLEALAGGCAGACQLLVTNPMEISKIRLQMQGETSRLLRAKGIKPPVPPNFWGVIKDLGFPGVYRGASACLLRDVPFSAIYFATYAACKETLVELNSTTGRASPLDLLLAGTIAGVPAALITTPADVVKSRLQSIARPGETSYAGIRDCATKIYRQEGIAAFFQGSAMRAARLAPQFGISLLLYESLAQLLGFNRASRPPTIIPVDPRDYHDAFSKRSFHGGGFFDRWLNLAQSSNER